MTDAPTLTGQDIGETQGAVSALLDEVLAATGTTSNEYIALRVLTLRGPSGAFREYLASQRQLGLDLARASALVDGLAARGLATETADGTTVVTGAGAALHTRLAGAVTDTATRLYADFDPGDLRVTHRVLTQVAERADRMRKEIAGAVG
jgi:DNA-binding MarR family transcriptional regulator